MPQPTHIRETFNKHIQWNPVIEKLFEDLETDIKCPFCDSSNVRVSWSVFNEEPRTASFDIGCVSCGEQMHAALLIPSNVPDRYSRT